jgi:anti-anti-sigma factor
VSDSGPRLTVHQDGPYHLRIVGEVDVSTAGMLRRRVASLGHGTVRLDMADVSFVDSSGLRVLLGAHNELAASGGRLELFRPSRALRRLLELTALDGHLHLVGGHADGTG